MGYGEVRSAIAARDIRATRAAMEGLPEHLRAAALEKVQHEMGEFAQLRVELGDAEACGRYAKRAMWTDKYGYHQGLADALRAMSGSVLYMSESDGRRDVMEIDIYDERFIEVCRDLVMDMVRPITPQHVGQHTLRLGSRGLDFAGYIMAGRDHVLDWRSSPAIKRRLEQVAFDTELIGREAFEYHDARLAWQVGYIAEYLLAALQVVECNAVFSIADFIELAPPHSHPVPAEEEMARRLLTMREEE